MFCFFCASLCVHSLFDQVAKVLRSNGHSGRLQRANVTGEKIVWTCTRGSAVVRQSRL